MVSAQNGDAVLELVEGDIVRQSHPPYKNCREILSAA